VENIMFQLFKRDHTIVVLVLKNFWWDIFYAHYKVTIFLLYIT